MAIYAVWNNIRSPAMLFRLTKGEWVISVFSALGMICFIAAFFYTSIANVTFLYGAMPIVTMALAAIFLRERLTAIAVLCCAASAVGVAVIMWGEQDFSDWTGFLLAFGMTFFMAALTIAMKFFPAADATKATYISALLAAAVMLPFSHFGAMSGADFGWLLLYGLVNVGLGFGVYLLGVARIPALMAALIGLAEIPLAPVWGWYLFNEAVSTRTMAGGAVILAAAIIYLWTQSLPQEHKKRSTVLN